MRPPVIDISHFAVGATEEPQPTLACSDREFSFLFMTRRAKEICLVRGFSCIYSPITHRIIRSSLATTERLKLQCGITANQSITQDSKSKPSSTCNFQTLPNVWPFTNLPSENDNVGGSFEAIGHDCWGNFPSPRFLTPARPSQQSPQNTEHPISPITCTMKFRYLISI
jgi:hypothetical protein